MKNQQILVDSKLAQLRAEHHELYTTWSDITFMSQKEGDGGVGVLVGGEWVLVVVGVVIVKLLPCADWMYLDNEKMRREPQFLAT